MIITFTEHWSRNRLYQLGRWCCRSCTQRNGNWNCCNESWFTSQIQKTTCWGMLVLKKWAIDVIWNIIPVKSRYNNRLGMYFFLFQLPKIKRIIFFEDQLQPTSLTEYKEGVEILPFRSVVTEVIEILLSYFIKTESFKRIQTTEGFWLITLPWS